MSWRLTFLFLVALLHPFSWATAGVNTTRRVTEQTKALQQNLREWQKTLDRMNFATLKLDQHWVERLNQERTMCVEGMKAADVVISAQLEEKQPGLMREVLLFNVLGKLQVNLASLLDFLNLSFYYPANAADDSGSRSVSVELQGKANQMMSAVQIAFETVQEDVVDRLIRVDKSSVSQVEAPVLPQRLPYVP